MADNTIPDKGKIPPEDYLEQERQRRRRLALLRGPVTAYLEDRLNRFRAVVEADKEEARERGENPDNTTWADDLAEEEADFPFLLAELGKPQYEGLTGLDAWNAADNLSFVIDENGELKEEQITDEDGYADLPLGVHLFNEAKSAARRARLAATPVAKYLEDRLNRFRAGVESIMEDARARGEDPEKTWAVVLEALAWEEKFYPYLLAELEKPEYEALTGLDVDTFYLDNEFGEPEEERETDADGYADLPPGALLFSEAYYAAYKASMTAQEKLTEDAEPEEDANPPPLPPLPPLPPRKHFTSGPVNTIPYPVGKEAGIWNPRWLEKRDVFWRDGRLDVFVVTSPEGTMVSTENAGILIHMAFDDIAPGTVAFTRELSVYDKHVYIHVYGLWLANGHFTLRSLHKAMTGDPKAEPNHEQCERLRASLRKMRHCEVLSIDNARELAAGMTGYREQKLKNHLLLNWNVEVSIVDGRVVDETYTLTEEPILMQFARERKLDGHGHLESIPAAAAALPGRMTAAKLELNDYITTRLAKMKGTARYITENPKACKKKPPRAGWNRIKFETVFEACGITGAVERTRKKKQILEALGAKKEAGLFKDYTVQKDGVTVNF